MATVTASIETLVALGLLTACITGWIAYRVGVAHGKEERRG